jgi:hypothetical protein
MSIPRSLQCAQAILSRDPDQIRPFAEDWKTRKDVVRMCYREDAIIKELRDIKFGNKALIRNQDFLAILLKYGDEEKIVEGIIGRIFHYECDRKKLIATYDFPKDLYNLLIHHVTLQFIFETLCTRYFRDGRGAKEVMQSCAQHLLELLIDGGFKIKEIPRGTHIDLLEVIDMMSEK